jgi:23S rRNA U2552 (ribose-2'-O)-methylase RlmE/FtsJ
MYNYGITCKQLDIPAIKPAIKQVNGVSILKKYALPDTIINSIETINNNQRILISNTKKDIDKTYKNGSWDYVKTLTNPYELVFSGSKKFVGRDIKYVKNNVCNYNPLSRSFFKMIEMSNVFLLKRYINQTYRPIKSLHLAEGPGGFIEGLIYLRKKYCSPNLQKQDLHYGITLIDDANTTEIPSWKKSTTFIRDNPNVIITSGNDNTGNLYHLDNIKYLHMRFANTMDIVTADGGFDFSVDYNSQEYLASRLIFCEIMGALVTLKKGGVFICKMFDLINKLSIDFLYLLQCKFEFIYIFKPKTSRLANSEKYIVCVSFRGISEEELERLYSIIELFKTNEEQNSTGDNIHHTCTYNIINSIFTDTPHTFKQFINGITQKIINTQTTNINYTLKLISKLNHGYLNSNYVSDIIQKQKQNAIQWCYENNMPVTK